MKTLYEIIQEEEQNSQLSYDFYEHLKKCLKDEESDMAQDTLLYIEEYGLSAADEGFQKDPESWK